MTMTAEEIVREYKGAKYPEKQIRILADQNSCAPSNIRTILEQMGCELPRKGRPKKAKIDTADGPWKEYDPKTKTFEKVDESPMKKDCDPDAPMPVLPAPEGAGEFQDETPASVDKAPALQVHGTVKQLSEALEDVLEEDADDTVSASEAVPLILRTSAVDVIARLLKESGRDTDSGQRFSEQVRGVLALIHEVEGRLGQAEG